MSETENKGLLTHTCVASIKLLQNCIGNLLLCCIKGPGRFSIVWDTWGDTTHVRESAHLYFPPPEKKKKQFAFCPFPSLLPRSTYKHTMYVRTRTYYLRECTHMCTYACTRMYVCFCATPICQGMVIGTCFLWYYFLRLHVPLFVRMRMYFWAPQYIGYWRN